ncbi:MAG: HD domain-containing protein [Lachnospiraceae bacterium]|nr:HD domain-containing protein [Lachnospiraceae bacterium]
MRQIPITALTPGMVTAADIVSYDHDTVVPKGIILTETIIARLEGYSIYYAQIEDNLTEELLTPMAVPAALAPEAAGDSSAAEALALRQQVQNFSQAFSRCAERYENSLMKSLHRNEPFRANELLKETLALARQDRQEASLLKMLLSAHTDSASVYSHCIDTALLSVLLARWLHFSEADQMMAAACGLFHDIGKFVLPAGIPRTPGKLTPDEIAIIKTHTTEGFHLLGRYGSIPDPVKNAALMHHEKCDGSGYPYGLTGDEIDRFSKIVAIADIFDAMLRQRAFRSAMCPLSIIRFFEDNSIHKYELKYILTFLENVSNTCLPHRVALSSGMDGNVIFVTPVRNAPPVTHPENRDVADLQAAFYQSILQLSGRKNLSIESII